MRMLTLAGASLLALSASVAAASATPTIFGFTGSSQTYTVFIPGLYSIVAAGAEGGASDQEFGGPGAQISGSFTLAAGETLSIAVGGVGSFGAAGASGGGGGGGSFVVGPDGKSLVIAGGGGGGSFNGGINQVLLPGANRGNGYVVIDSPDFGSPAPVPEPASLAVFSAGLLGLVAARRARPGRRRAVG